MLVTVAQYRTVTFDVTTAAAPASAALAEAQELVEDLLDRWLESAERTETLQIKHRGLVYPRALPVTAVATGSAVSGDLVHGGHAVRLTSAPEALVTLTDVGATRFDDTTAMTGDLTYTGGFTSTTLPALLRRGICRLARAILTSAAYSGGGNFPLTVTSTSLGDASVSFAGSATTGASAAIDELVPGLSAALSRYRRNEGY